jgi:hypothetical protein
LEIAFHAIVDFANVDAAIGTRKCWAWLFGEYFSVSSVSQNGHRYRAMNFRFVLWQGCMLYRPLTAYRAPTVLAAEFSRDSTTQEISDSRLIASSAGDHRAFLPCAASKHLSNAVGQGDGEAFCNGK